MALPIGSESFQSLPESLIQSQMFRFCFQSDLLPPFVKRKVADMLTDAECKAAEPKEKAYKIYAEGALYLLVKPNGSKLWQMKYAYDSKARTLSIGRYGSSANAVSLSQARAARDTAKKLLREGKDPTTARKIERLGMIADRSVSLSTAVAAWWKSRSTQWVPKHASDVKALLATAVPKSLGSLPLTMITRRMVLDLVLKPLQNRGTHVGARRARTYLQAVFRFAASQDWVAPGFNPADEDLLEGLSPLPPVKHHNALTDIDDLRIMFRAVEECPSKPVTKLATRFIALTAVRMFTLINAQWDQFKHLDGDNPTWDIPAWMMKGERDAQLPFLIPLSRQAVDVLRVMRGISGDVAHVFPSDVDRKSVHISNNAILFSLYRAGYRGRHTAHGFRSSFSTYLNNLYPELSHVIDFALAHVPKGQVEAAYNRAQYMDTRRMLHQRYADDLLKDASEASSLLDGLRH